MKREREQPRFTNFTKAFRNLSKELAGAYSLSDKIYSQSASISRFEEGTSLNTPEFLKYVRFDPDKATEIIDNLQKSRKLSGIRVNLSTRELLNLKPDSEVRGRSATIGTLLHSAAIFESLLSKEGIPPVYSLAQGQTEEDLRLVYKAAEKAYDWKGSKRLNKVAQAAMVGILALAGCDGITVNFPTPEITTGQGTTPTSSEVVPAITETVVPTSTQTLEPTEVITPTAMVTVEPTQTITPTETATITPTETATPAPAGTELPFDTSSPETITATDGNQYEGYYIEDHYGRRLVDSTNNIILVKDGDQWRVAESSNYSPEYPAVFYETKIGHSDGFDIPITMGLSENATRTSNKDHYFPFTEVHMTPKGADDAANMFLGSCWGRYKNIMGHPDVTYAQYLELVREGKGDIEVYDVIHKTRVLIDPRQGFSVVITGDTQTNMPLRCYDDPGYYFTSDEKGRFLLAENAAYNSYSMLLETEQPGTMTNSIFLVNEILLIETLDNLSDSTMANPTHTNGCPISMNPENNDEIVAKFKTDVINYHQGKSDDPLFTMR